ncbi:hypothetical protein KR054_009077, partial [Drosophila jambulina]
MDGVCRVCLLTSGEMINIFDGTPESSISIANIVAQYTGCEVKRGDSFPETICCFCLQDARNRSVTAQSLDPNYNQVLAQVKEEFPKDQIVTPDWPQIKKEDPDPDDELLEEQVCEVTDSESESSSSEEDSSYHLDFQVKRENLDNEIRRSPNFDVKVKAEPIEEDIVEDGIFEDQTEESNSDQYFDLVVKEEQMEDMANDDDNVSQPFKCTYCPSSYSRKANLNVHLRTHTGELPYECSFCEKSFNQRQFLKDHLRIHTGERPHKCPQCEKAFRTATDRKHHQLTHLKDRPHKCMHCPKSFVKMSRLRKHMRTHTRERTFNCTRCPAKFPLKELRREHSRIHKKPKEESFNCP